MQSEDRPDRTRVRPGTSRVQSIYADLLVVADRDEVKVTAVGGTTITLRQDEARDLAQALERAADAADAWARG